MKLKDIIEETKQLMMKDDTITCYGDTIMTDCNNRVSPSSIALREDILYLQHNIIKLYLNIILMNQQIILLIHIMYHIKMLKSLFYKQEIVGDI